MRGSFRPPGGRYKERRRRPPPGDGPPRPVWDAWLRLASLQLRGTSHWSEEERGFLAESHMEEHASTQPPPHHALLELLRAHDAAFFDERSFSAEASVFGREPDVVCRSSSASNGVLSCGL